MKELIIIFLPFRDALGFFIGSTPIRIGELFSVFWFGQIANNLTSKINRKEGLLLFTLFLNLLITFLGVSVFHDTINANFAIKYIIRNILNFVFVTGFIFSTIKYNEDDIERLVKFVVVLQFCTFIVLYVFQHYFYMGSLYGIEDYRDSGLFVGSIWLPRFIGTCSEPGYLAPILSFPLFFYLKRILNQKKRHDMLFLSMCFLMVVFTFSAAVYFMAALITTYVVIENLYTKKTVNKMMAYILLIFGLGIIVFIWLLINNSPLLDYVIDGIIYKIVAYLTLVEGEYMSSSDRIQQLGNCVFFILDGNFLQLLIGHGTGGYANFSMATGELISSAEEAYNLYLSTLADRGLLGLGCLVMLFICLKSMIIKGDLYSQTIFLALLSQFMHWMIVGNFWLYYFWYEVVLLVGYYKYKSTMNS